MCGSDKAPDPPPPPAPPPVETGDVKVAPEKKKETVRSTKRKGKQSKRKDLTIAKSGTSGSGVATGAFTA